MNRTIKFRGKLLDENKTWVYGFLMKGLNDIYYILSEQSISKNSSQIIHFQVNPKTIGQYVGWKDRQGVEVYEDDYIKGYEATENLGFKVGNYIVEFEDSAWCANSVTGETDCYLDFFAGNPTQVPEGICEVIGNKHDNPTLFPKK